MLTNQIFDVENPGVNNFSVTCETTGSRPAPSSVQWFIGKSNEYTAYNHFHFKMLCISLSNVIVTNRIFKTATAGETYKHKLTCTTSLKVLLMQNLF